MYLGAGLRRPAWRFVRHFPTAMQSAGPRPKLQPVADLVHYIG